MQTRTQLETKFNKTRGSLLLVVMFSLANMLLLLLESDITFLFSASFPNYAVVYGVVMTALSGEMIHAIVSISLAAAVVGLFALCYFLSKKRRFFIIVALALFSLDTIFLIWVFTLDLVENINFLPDAIFHIAVMFSLISGTITWAKLRKMPLYDEATAIEDANAPSLPLRPASKKGKPALSQTFDNLEISVKNGLALTELIVNDMVYAERKGLISTGCELTARVDNASIKAVMDHTGSIFLYVNDNLLAQKKRYL